MLGKEKEKKKQETRPAEFWEVPRPPLGLPLRKVRTGRARDPQTRNGAGELNGPNSGLEP